MSDEQVSELRYIEELEAEVEKLGTTNKKLQGRLFDAEAKLAEVEKELHEVCASHEALRQSSLERLASIERARELVEELITPPVTRSPWPAGAQEDLQTIARLLSGKAE